MKYGREVAVLGIGMHPWGMFPEQDTDELTIYAIKEALKDADLKWKDIQYMADGICQWRGQTGLITGNEVAFSLGATGIPTPNFSNGCASGLYTLKAAVDQVRLGVADIAIAVGSGKSPGGFYPLVPPATPVPLDIQILRWKVGLPNPAYWAMSLMRRMKLYGDTEEMWAKIRVKASKAGAANPLARYRKVFTVEEVLKSRMVCYPLRVYEICATSQGAAAVIVGSLDVAKKRTTKPILVAGTGTASPIYGDATLRMMSVSAVVKETAPYLSEGYMASKRAFEEAGMGPKDIDIAEVPDNCPWHEMAYFEADGFCKPGEAGHLADEGYTEIDGRLPVNMSGGMLSYGESMPAQGLQQICDCVKQMRRKSTYQVPKAVKTAFCQSYAGHGSNGVAILKS